MNKIKKFKWGIITESRFEMMGVLALGIVFYHFCLDGLKIDGFPKLLKPYGMYGNSVSDAFLFLSGISCFCSLSNYSSMPIFYRKRFVRVYLPFVIISLPLFLWNCIINQSKITWLLFDITGLTSFSRYDKQYWFVTTILICYLISPLIYKLAKRDNRSIPIIIVVYTVLLLILKTKIPDLYDMVEIGITRIPVFMLGMQCGKKVKYNNLLKMNPVLVGLLLMTGAGIFKILLVIVEYKYQIDIRLWERYWLGIVGIAITFILSSLLSKLRNFNIHERIGLILWGGVRNVGRISLELYISHMTIRYVINYYIIIEQFGGLVFAYIMILLLSLAISFFTSKLVSFMKQYCNNLNISSIER